MKPPDPLAHLAKFMPPGWRKQPPKATPVTLSSYSDMLKAVYTVTYIDKRNGFVTMDVDIVAAEKGSDD